MIGRPFLPRATLHLPNGNTFRIVAEPLDDAHPYIGDVKLNGKPWSRTWIGYTDITAGGELHFTMQAAPNKSWGAAADERPYSMSSAR